jgi:hypothetical protein
MRHHQFLFIILFLLTMMFSSSVTAQSWEFNKEKDGIKIYTRQETGKSLKSYRGVVDIHAPAETAFALIDDVYHTEWWDKNLPQIKVLRYERCKKARYYVDLRHADGRFPVKINNGVKERLEKNKTTLNKRCEGTIEKRIT